MDRRQVDRRTFILTSTLAGVAAPFLVEAQQAGRVWKVGVLEPGHLAVQAHLIEAFRQGLRELGYLEGRNLVIERRFAEGTLERLPELAAELARLKVDVIVAAGTPAIKAARQATREIPIIMSAVGDPVGEGLVASLARPGGNITGVTVQSPELSAKRLQLLKEAVPRVSRVAIVWDPRIVHEVNGFNEAEIAARSLGLTLLSVRVKRPDDLEVAFAGAARDGANGVFVFPNSITTDYGKRIADLALKHRLPGVYGVGELAEAGGLLAYGPVRADNYRKVAAFVDKVLTGARPGDLPIQQPTKFELVINLRTAKALGLAIPQSVLLRADRVIE